VRLRLAITAALALVSGCQLATTRPPFEPLPEARHADLALPRGEATARVAEALREDSIPLARVEPRDGYMESAWFEAETGRVVPGGRLGARVVRVRGWIEPVRVRQSELRMEAVFRRTWDPSLPERELERSVAPDHPVLVRLDSVIARLVRRYGFNP
jgi:hypothetical protein